MNLSTPKLKKSLKSRCLFFSKASVHNNPLPCYINTDFFLWDSCLAKCPEWMMLSRGNSYSVLSSFISVRSVPYLSFKPCSRTRNFFTGIFLLLTAAMRVSQFSPNPCHSWFYRRGIEEQSHYLWGLAAASGTRSQGKGTAMHLGTQGRQQRSQASHANHGCRSTVWQSGREN